MSQIFTNFPYLPRWYCFTTFLCHVAFWDDLREFKVENFNFKQASLFFSEKRSDLSLNAFLERNMRYFGVVDDISSFFMKKGAEFSENRAQFLLRRSVFKISVRQHTLFFDVFFNVSRAIGQPDVNQFFQNFCQRCSLLVSTLMPSFILISWM